MHKGSRRRAARRESSSAKHSETTTSLLLLEESRNLNYDLAQGVVDSNLARGVIL